MYYIISQNETLMTYVFADCNWSKRQQFVIKDASGEEALYGIAASTLDGVLSSSWKQLMFLPCR